MLQTVAVLALAAMSSVSAYTTEDLSLYEEDASDPRVFFANYTSGDEGLLCVVVMRVVGKVSCLCSVRCVTVLWSPSNPFPPGH